MDQEIIKTGQHIDEQKRLVLIPHIAKLIQWSTSPNDTQLSFLDIGAGDGSFAAELRNQLATSGKFMSLMSLVDLSTLTMPKNIESTINIGNDDGAFVNTIKTVERTSSVGYDLNHYESSFDIALTSLMLHQVSSPALITLYLCRTFMGLANNGELFIADLHPKYLQFLSETTSKFAYTTSNKGTFNFDSGGTNEVNIHRIPDILAWAFSTGFEFSLYSEPSLEPIASMKPRYQEMIAQGIPLYYVLSLRKRYKNFVHYSEGQVKSTEKKDNYLHITFTDKEYIGIPWPSSKSDVPQENDSIVILTTKHPRERQKAMINVWIIPEDEHQETRHTELCVSKAE